MSDFNLMRLGMFTASEIHKLLTTGRRNLTEEELKNREKGDKRTTVDVEFGDTAMTYIYTKVAEILTGRSADSFQTWEMEYGKNTEPYAMEWYEKVTGATLERYGDNNYLFVPYNNYSGCSPDALTSDRKINVQIKCPANSVNFIKVLAAKDKLQYIMSNYPEYYTQVQFEMMCLKVDLTHLVYYDSRLEDPKMHMVVIEIPKNEDFCQIIDSKLQKAHNVKKGILNAANEIPEIGVKSNKQIALEELAEIDRKLEMQRNGSVQLEITG